MNCGNYHRVALAIPTDINRCLYQDFLRLYDAKQVRQTHYFGGRYENIYIEDQSLPALTDLKNEIVTHAGALLGIPVEQLSMGCWFNAMAPGHVTQVHSHDDYDELLSGVYYIALPENSGQLILHTEQGPVPVPARVGDGVFFMPDLAHEVSRNDSRQLRLAVGFNIGPMKTSERT